MRIIVCRGPTIDKQVEFWKSVTIEEKSVLIAHASSACLNNSKIEHFFQTLDKPKLFGPSCSASRVDHYAT